MIRKCHGDPRDPEATAPTRISGQHGGEHMSPPSEDCVVISIGVTVPSAKVNHFQRSVDGREVNDAAVLAAMPVMDPDWPGIRTIEPVTEQMLGVKVVVTLLQGHGGRLSSRSSRCHMSKEKAIDATCQDGKAGPLARNVTSSSGGSGGVKI